MDMKKERGPHLPLFSISQDLSPHHTAAEEAQQHLYFLMTLGKFGFLIKQLPELLTATPAEATGDLPAFPPGPQLPQYRLASSAPETTVLTVNDCSSSVYAALLLNGLIACLQVRANEMDA